MKDLTKEMNTCNDQKVRTPMSRKELISLIQLFVRSLTLVVKH